MTLIRKPEAPWVFRATGAFVENARELAQEQGSRLAVYEIDGANTGDFGGLFAEFAAVLQFPDYFGSNLAAFEDCLGDLDWIEPVELLIVISNSNELLASQTEEDLEAVIEVFQDVAEGWAEPVDEGEEWDRDAVPFHVALVGCDPPVREVIAELELIDW
ncbi:MAG: barstar family protein [Planctomycetota bacterium]